MAIRARVLLVAFFLSVGIVSAAAALDALAVPENAPENAALARHFLALPRAQHTTRYYEGANAALAQAAVDARSGQIGAAVPLTAPPDQLFGEGREINNRQFVAAAITSIDAHALRIQVNFPDESENTPLYTVDPIGQRVFGPASKTDSIQETLVLPLVEGDTALLVADVTEGALPTVSVTGLSHIFVDMRAEPAAKELWCNVNIACETDPAIQALSTAVGRVVVTFSSLSTVWGSGTLLEWPDTPEREPFFLTAHHVLGDPSAVARTEIFWDFRSSECASDDSPPLAQLPRSKGNKMLAENENLDLVLIRLKSVPTGAYGRTYAGWDVREPVQGEDVIGIHHPEGTHMRICYGRVREVDVPVAVTSSERYAHETEVGWDDGVTEQGSSGSGVFFDDGTLALFGALTSGTAHICGAGAGYNRDNYSSLRHFFTISFPDTALASAVRAAIGQSTGTIYMDKLVSNNFTTLTAPGIGISDLTGLEYCADLTDIDLADNAITSLTPLLNNPSIGAGTTIDLTGNPLDGTSCSAIATLQSRGVRVIHDQSCGLCPAEVAFKESPQVLSALRQFRDQGLARSATGRLVIAKYYACAPRLAAVIQESVAARKVFSVAAFPFAFLGSHL